VGADVSDRKVTGLERVQSSDLPAEIYNLHDECHYHISTTNYLAANYLQGFLI
jgi:hypothetical protein